MDELVLPAIDIAGLDAVAALRTRFDSKFLLDEGRLLDVGRALVARGDWRMLAVDGRTDFDYTTVYFDRDLLTFRHHLQGRRRRFKVRTRSYSDQSRVVLELKTKTGRGQTVKQRRDRSGDGPPLEPDEATWIDERLGAVGISAIGAELSAALAVRYRRTTLVDVAGGERVTIDRDLRVRRLDTGGFGDEEVVVLPTSVIVEVKGDRPRSASTARLQERGHRPLRLSKYCLGVGAVDPGLDRGMLRAARREADRLARRPPAPPTMSS